jgi:threonine/homoserine/homoserine lactone efflux protein
VGGQLLAFLGVSLMVIVIPGPDTALTVRNALAGGRRAGVATAAGVATGQAVWTIATSFGIAELIQASEPAFLALRVAGAAYLVALGIQSLWKALWTTRHPQSAVGHPPGWGPSIAGLRCGAPGSRGGSRPRGRVGPARTRGVGG